MTAKQEQIMCDQESELEDLRSKQCLLCNGSLGHHKPDCKGAIPWQELYNNHNAACVKLEKAIAALNTIATGSGCYCECNQPVELCECSTRIAREAIVEINSDK